VAFEAGSRPKPLDPIRLEVVREKR
jgi:hypothetical protein